MQPLSGTEKTTLASLTFACLLILNSSWRNDGEPLYASLAISGLAFAFTYCTIRWTGDVFIKQGFGGEDRSKKHKPRLYRSLHSLFAFKTPADNATVQK